MSGNREETRLAAARRFVAGALGHSPEAPRLAPLSGDASFRRYFRVRARDGDTWVLMDAPPGREDVRPFLAVRAWLEETGVRVPGLAAADVGAGFLLLEDFGDVTWAAHLAAGGEAEPLAQDAFHQLLRMQGASGMPDLPRFDLARMRAECDLYLDWYLPRVAGYVPGEDERRAFHAVLTPLLEGLVELPLVPVHLDYHSRNLMLPPDGLPLGVIDFQDAVLGPVTYDAASLLYDCYQDYPESWRRDRSAELFAALPEAVRAAFDGFEDWHRALRRTALQRHIKAIGIFARLAHRDGKHAFLDEIPLTRKHLMEEMAALGGLPPAASRLLAMQPDSG